MSTERLVIDVRPLPGFAFGTRDVLFWGVALLAAIETTGFLLMAMTYLYVRRNFDVWPPTAFGPSALRLEAIATAILVLAFVPTHLMNRAARANDRVAMMVSLAVAAALYAAVLVLRAFEMKALPFRWDSHVHGSIVWTTLGMHVTHTIASFVENTLLCVIYVSGRDDPKHRADIEVNGFYNYFVGVSWLPLFALMYLEPVVLG